jgi:hypothetical protein
MAAYLQLCVNGCGSGVVSSLFLLFPYGLSFAPHAKYFAGHPVSSLWTGVSSFIKNDVSLYRQTVAMMRGFFKRRSSAAGGLPDSQPFNKSVPFTPDDPFMVAWPEITVQALTADPGPDFAKFRAWVENHPDTEPHFSLRKLVPGIASLQNEFCRYALRSQILQGFQFLASCDKLLKEAHSVVLPAPIAHPFDAGRSLASVGDRWRTLLAHYAILKDLKSTSEELKEHVVTSITRDKNAVASLISLLAAADALPPQYLIVVNFSSFDLDDIETTRRLKIMKFCATQEKRSNQAIVKASQAIDEIAQRFSKDKNLETPDAQLTWVQEFVDVAASVFDEKRFSLPITYDGSEFMDFFMHPVSIGNLFISHFLTSQESDPVRFRALTEMIVAHLNFQERPKALAVNALISSLIGPMFVPDIPFDGNGTTDDDVLALALTLVSYTDPLLILAEIAGSIRDGDPDAAVQAAVDAIAALTSSARAVLSFAYEFTAPEYLPDPANAIRAAIARKFGFA